MTSLCLGHLRLEILADRAHLLLQLRLALDELCLVRGSRADEFSLRGAELVGELGGALLLAPERPQLVSHVVQLSAGAPELSLHRFHGVPGVERLEMSGVQLFL